MHEQEFDKNVVTALARPTNIHVAQTLYNMLCLELKDRGWQPALFGACIEDAHLHAKHRDVDFILVPIQPTIGVPAFTQDEVVEHLANRQFDIKIDQQIGDLRGIVGLWHGYAVDITIAGRVVV